MHGVFLDVRWFYANLSRMQAEDMLCRISYEGAFLVRQRTDQHNVTDSSQFAISFRYARIPDHNSLLFVNIKV